MPVGNYYCILKVLKSESNVSPFVACAGGVYLSTVNVAGRQSSRSSPGVNDQATQEDSSGQSCPESRQSSTFAGVRPVGRASGPLQGFHPTFYPSEAREGGHLSMVNAAVRKFPRSSPGFEEVGVGSFVRRQSEARGT